MTHNRRYEHVSDGCGRSLGCWLFGGVGVVTTRTPIERRMAGILGQMNIPFREQVGVGLVTRSWCSSAFPCRHAPVAWDPFAGKNVPGDYCSYAGDISRMTGGGCRWHKRITHYRYVVDFGVSGNGWKLAVECDGQAYHQDAGRERKRDAFLARLGWTVLHFPGRQIYRYPQAVGRKIHATMVALAAKQPSDAKHYSPPGGL